MRQLLHLIELLQGLALIAARRIALCALLLALREHRVLLLQLPIQHLFARFDRFQLLHKLEHLRRHLHLHLLLLLLLARLWCLHAPLLLRLGQFRMLLVKLDHRRIILHLQRLRLLLVGSPSPSDKSFHIPPNILLRSPIEAIGLPSFTSALFSFE